ncbi:polyphosphate kinase 1 [Legionella sp. W05-934-2]|uniref:polyphosphate kinase 1 n=1 Tax=Legionella sp. W05-934-2 TaxID=1198649 RepID=UPI0034623A7E
MKSDHSQDIPYINREFSLLKFNERILELACDAEVPLLERMRFLCICSSNLDEFFEVRIAELKRLMKQNPDKVDIDGLKPGEIFDELSIRLHDLIKQVYATYNDKILPALTSEGITIIEPKDWNKAIHKWSKDYFYQHILPLVSPIALDLAHPFPRLINKSLNFFITLKGTDAFNRQIDYALVHAPRSLPRVIPVPHHLSADGKTEFVYLASLFEYYAYALFPGMKITGCYQVRLTRNSDVYLHEEEIEDLALALQRELYSRHYGDVVRLELDKNCPEEILHFLQRKYQLTKKDTYFCDGPVNLQRFSQALQHIHREDLKYPKFTPKYPPFHSLHKNMFDILNDEDILIHLPYQSFDLVVDFIQKASKDPEVLAIKQTLYRVDSNSAIVDALVHAARTGKEVTAIIELRARFNEESNLKLASRLHEAGVLVLYGVLGHKSHAKMALVVRRHEGEVKRYVHLGTGNYHEKIAHEYTDLGLLTSDQDITTDVQFIFQQLTGLGKTIKLKKLFNSPFTLQEQLLFQIKRCINAAKKGQKCEIIIKVNGINDKPTIDALYQASKAKVKITLIVRSICCLKPGIPGVSDNIRVISYAGRFLEHHRVFYFRIHDMTYYFLSSADLMERNLYHRIEILFPIFDPQIQQRIDEEILVNYCMDEKNTWEMLPDGNYRRLSKGKDNAQERLIAKFSQ